MTHATPTKPGEMTADGIRDLLEEIDDASDDSMEFRVIQDALETFSAERPLMIIIHPGDMIELDRIEEVLDLQEGLAGEMSVRPDHDLVILHRNSCSQIGNVGADRCTWGFADQFEADWPRAMILHGDDLDAAGAWMIENLALEGRPEIFMGGAYGDPEDGCLTHVGQMIETVAAGKIVLSGHVMCNGDTSWVPAGPDNAPAP